MDNFNENDQQKLIIALYIHDIYKTLFGVTEYTFGLYV